MYGVVFSSRDTAAQRAVRPRGVARVGDDEDDARAAATARETDGWMAVGATKGSLCVSFVPVDEEESDAICCDYWVVVGWVVGANDVRRVLAGGRVGGG